VTAAVIGCGEIGGPVALRLARALPTLASDLDGGRRRGLAAQGLRVTADAADCADVVFVCVATEAQMSAVVDQLPDEPKYLVLLSTVSPAAVDEAAAALPSARVIDAPVSGGAEGARAGR